MSSTAEVRCPPLTRSNAVCPFPANFYLNRNAEPATGFRTNDIIIERRQLGRSQTGRYGEKGVEISHCCERASRRALCIDVDLLEIVAVHGLGLARIPELPSLAYILFKRLRCVWCCAWYGVLAESWPCFAFRLSMP